MCHSGSTEYRSKFAFRNTESESIEIKQFRTSTRYKLSLKQQQYSPLLVALNSSHPNIVLAIQIGQ